MTQRDLARMTGYCRLSISNYEKGTQRVPLDTLDTITKALKVPLNVLFTDDASSEARYWKNQYLSKEQQYQKLKIKVNEFVKMVRK